MTDLLNYLRRISPDQLRVANARSGVKPYPGGQKSPYKPLLLLTVLRMIHKRDRAFSRGLIRFADCLEHFVRLKTSIYGEIFDEDLTPQVVQPYWYFGAGVPRLWNLVPCEGKTLELNDAISGALQIKTRRKLEQLVAMAQVQPSDLDLLSDEAANNAIRAYLVATYFKGHETTVFAAISNL